jgi:hypothetical protein
MHNGYGPIALLGSGETSLAGGWIFESLTQQIAELGWIARDTADGQKLVKQS